MEKHVERHFDIEKEQVPVLDTPQNKTIDVQSQETDGGNNGNGSKNKMVAIIAVIVLIVIAFVAYRSCGTNESKVDEFTNTIVSDSTEKADTTSNEEKSASPISEQSQSTSSEVSSGTGTNAESDNTSAVPTTKSESSGNSIEEKAMQVWDGVYGNGTERKSKLGSDYKAVQKRVNEMYRNGYRH